MEKIALMNITAQNAILRPEIDKAIAEVIDSGQFAGGSFVEKFENEFAEFCGTKYCVGVGSGTEALWLSLLAAGIGEGHEVITTPSTFIATCEAITYTGAEPVFVDINPTTYTIDVNKIRAAITKRTKAIIPVHLFGQCAEMDEIMKIAKEFNLLVIEDACQAHGAEYKNRRAGSLGHLGCFSFYPGKNLGAMGEAGAITTNSHVFYNTIKKLRDHGQTRKYYHSLVGWNCRMDGIQAAVLSVKLKQLDKNNKRRAEIAALYSEQLEEESLVLPRRSVNKSAWHLYVVRTCEKIRTQLIEDLAKNNIYCGIHYPIPVHLQEAYVHLEIPEGSFPVAEKCAKEFISLPMCPTLTNEEVKYICKTIKEIL